jgi:DNA repair photolyase
MYKGKIIYNPSGKAGEYSYWAANFYNGCSGDCSYCYMKDPPLNQNWSTKPTLKKSLGDIEKAYEIFDKECAKNIDSLRKHGLFFNFNSDPFLKETFQLNFNCMFKASMNHVPIKILTKQTWWIDEPIFKHNNHFIIGFTLTGHDEMEPCCATNAERIRAMKILKKRGYKTWASIEPIIDIHTSMAMIVDSQQFCDHYKIGLLSGSNNDRLMLLKWVTLINNICDKPIYWKDELLKQAGINRQDLPSNCVGRDYL